MIKKQCKNCRATKPIKEFGSNGYSKIGTKSYKPYCKDCYNQRLRNERIRKDKAYLQRLKTRQEYVKNNKEKIRELARRHYNKMSDKEKEELNKRNYKAWYKRRVKQLSELAQIKRDRLL